ncbi:MAG: hypothetical protein H0U49_07310 [Parachlamydiaceae bacterium]|nr:hypothetical protein [Parachlamydiaceae bacterium]
MLKCDLEAISCDYEEGKKQNLESSPKEISSGDCMHLLTEATEQRQEIAEKHNFLKVKLLAKINVSTAIELARHGGKALSLISFQECIDCLLSDDVRSYKLKNPNLSDSDIHEIAHWTLQIIDLNSHAAHLGRIVELAEQIHEIVSQPKQTTLYRSLCQRLEVELSARYHFDEGFGSEERIAFHVFSSQSGMIPFQKQVDLIKKMLKTDSTDFADQKKYRDIVIQLIMGGGKTSVIATLILFLASMRDGRLALFIAPPALFKIFSINLADGFQKAFGKEVKSIDAAREEFTLHNLKKISHELQRSENAKQPVIFSAITLQGMELELLSLARRLKVEIRIRDALARDFIISFNVEANLEPLGDGHRGNDPLSEPLSELQKLEESFAQKTLSPELQECERLRLAKKLLSHDEGLSLSKKINI